MAKKMQMKPLVAAIGTAFLASVATTQISAAENPFGMTKLNGGYMQLAGNKCGGEPKCGVGAKCGESKCGASKSEAKCGEGKCGSSKSEGKCGGSKPAAKCGEGKCGGSKPAAKCGEGKCGGSK